MFANIPVQYVDLTVREAAKAFGGRMTDEQLDRFDEAMKNF